MAVPAGDQWCLDHLRSRAARTSQLTDTLDDEPWLPDAAAAALAERTVSRMDLERALAQLPEGCRAAFVLHDVEGLEHGEVADVLGIAEGTSKSQVHKARMRLRELLAGTSDVIWLASSYPKRFRRWWTARLGPIRRAELEVHLDQCDDCRAPAARPAAHPATPPHRSIARAPPDRVWLQIAGRLRQEGRLRPPAAPGAPRRRALRRCWRSPRRS